MRRVCGQSVAHSSARRSASARLRSSPRTWRRDPSSLSSSQPSGTARWKPDDPSWGSNLSNTNLYDVALFGWQSTAVAIADTAANYITDGQNNFYGYSNPDVDALYDELQATTDSARQDEILIEVEKVLFDDAFGLPIFQFPAITAYNSNYVDGISNIPLAPTVFFNVWDWTPVG